MANYILSCCSTADLSEQHFRERDIHYICFHYMLNGKSYSDDLGRLIPRFKIRGKNKVIREIAARMVEHAQDGTDYSGKCYISNSACMEDAQAVARLVEERFPRLSGKVEINSIGTTIGSHTGPGTVALFFWGDERVR